MGLCSQFEQDFVPFTDYIWEESMLSHHNGHPIHWHPDYTTEATTYFYEEAVVGVSTAAYMDVKEVLDAIQRDHIAGTKHAYKAMFHIGDQQTYHRLKENPEELKWVINVPGEFHFMAHCIDAMHRLWWSKLGQWAVKVTEHEKIIQEKDDNIVKFKQYDRFYTLLTVAIVTLLHDTLPMHCLLDPHWLLDYCDDNKGQCSTTCPDVAFSLQGS